MNSLGSITRLTTAQILFLALATTEDTRIKSMAGPVEREGVDADAGKDGSLEAKLEYSRNYAKMRKGMMKDGEIQKELEALRKEQEKSGLRQFVDESIKAIIEGESRSEWGTILSADEKAIEENGKQKEIWEK